MLILKLIRRPQKDPTLREYIIVLALTWAYTLCWCAGLVAAWMLWEGIANTTKVLVSMFLVVGTPSIQDLFVSYQQFKNESSLVAKE